MEAAAGDSLAAWAATAEAVAATTKRLEKGSILARYLAALDTGAVAVAARFFGGTVFAHHDARTTRVGPALLTDALTAVSGADPATLGGRHARAGADRGPAAEVVASPPDGRPRPRGLPG